MPRIVEASQENDGSRFLEARLGEGACDDAERDKIYEDILPATLKLSSDLYGSVVMQKLLTRATAEQRVALTEKLKGEVFNLSTHRYGCRVIQKMIEVLSEEERVPLAAELRGRIIECVENMHGNHVVQICVRMLPLASVSFILEAIVTSVDKMSGHMYGCRIIQRLIERLPREELEGLLGPIMSNIAKLAKDKHGNYVVQCILEKGRKEDKQKIMQVIRESFLEFSKDKVSSNVVEKCFYASTEGSDAEFLRDEREALYQTVLGNSGDEENAPLQLLMHDRFGNYTVQCVIKHSRGEDRDALEKRILAAEPQLKESGTGRHVIAALKKVTGQTVDGDAPEGENATPSAPSRGSLAHASGQCKPCAWFWKAQGCKNDQNCQHCHLCPEGELKERKKAKRMNRRDVANRSPERLALPAP